MNSKEALEKLSYIPIYKEDEHNVITDIDSCCIYKGDLCEVYGSEVDTIEKDLDRLEEYRKIEEEIGIDLIKAVELCKQVNSKKVVYTKENWGIGTLEFLDDLDIELFNHRLYVSARGMYISLDLYEYGKTRSISREELEQ